MIELKHIIAPIDDTPFEDICSFETDSYIGMYVESVPGVCLPGFAIMPKKRGDEFSIAILKVPDSLDKFDTLVYDKTKEHISCVSTSRCLDIKIYEDY